jgi:sulfur carrier protein
MALTVLLNGTRRTFADLETPASLADVVAGLGLQPDRVAIESNGEIVPRSTWTASSIWENDKLEIVHFVGGGGF